MVQTYSNFSAIDDGQPGTFSSGSLVFAGTYSLCFNKAGTYYYKSQNTASLMGTITVVDEFVWTATQAANGNSLGNLAVGGDVNVGSNLNVISKITADSLDTTSKLTMSGYWDQSAANARVLCVEDSTGLFHCIDIQGGATSGCMSFGYKSSEGAALPRTYAYADCLRAVVGEQVTTLSDDGLHIYFSGGSVWTRIH